MKIKSAVLALTAGLLGSAASAQVLVHDYQFLGNLNDSVGSLAITSNGGVLGVGSLTFGANQGPTLNAENSLVGNYSIGLRFSLSNLTSYRKIIDFKGLASDAGLYAQDGNLIFFPATVFGAATFLAGRQIDVVITRDSSSNLFTTYLNGAAQFSFTDSSNLAVAGSLSPSSVPFSFFHDDFATAGSESSAGVVNEIRVWNGALSASAVSSAFAPLSTGTPGVTAVPEPSTYALTGVIALTGMIALKRRKAKASASAA